MKKCSKHVLYDIRLYSIKYCIVYAYSTTVPACPKYQQGFLRSKIINNRGSHHCNIVTAKRWRREQSFVFSDFNFIT